MADQFRILEINGGRVERGKPYTLKLSAGRKGYADAQFDDYGGLKRHNYPWFPGTMMRVRARFSRGAGHLVGTAGFGFWNAPFGDPTVRWPTLPQVVWFFYASAPSDLPLAKSGPGRHWFAATLDASRPTAWLLAPLAPLVLILNQVSRTRDRIWPKIRERFGISYAPLRVDMTQWHDYRLSWQRNGCGFWVDGEEVLSTLHTPRGPLGFVCWLDNQYLVATPRGRFRWGTLTVGREEWLELEDLELAQT